MDFIGGNNTNIAAYRLEHFQQIRQFKTELLHLVQKAARTWWGQAIDALQCEATLEMFEQNVISPRVFLALAIDDQFKACGYIFGIAKPELKAFALHSFYAKEEVLQPAFDEMFGALDRYCYQAEIRHLEFQILTELPYSNPRLQAFLKRFHPKVTLSCDLEKQDVTANAIQPEEAPAPVLAAARGEGHGEQGDSAA